MFIRGGAGDIAQRQIAPAQRSLTHRQARARRRGTREAHHAARTTICVFCHHHREHIWLAACEGLRTALTQLHRRALPITIDDSDEFRSRAFVYASTGTPLLTETTQITVSYSYRELLLHLRKEITGIFRWER